MSSKRLLLLSTLLKSTSSINAIKHSTDKKKKKKAVGNIIAQIVIALMILVYAGLISIGLGFSGAADVLPVMAATLISIMSFFLALFKTNGYMFAFKEYDMLMSMPFPVKTIVADKFIYMYIKSLSWAMMISVSVLAGYAYFKKPGIAIYIVWIALSLLLPLLPIVAASLIGTLIAKVGSHFKYKRIVQTVITFIIIIPLFFLQYIIEAIFKENKVSSVVNTVSEALDTGAGFYLPAEWFAEAVTDLKITSIIFFVAASVLIFEAFVAIVAKYYRNINSRLMSSTKNTVKTKLNYSRKNPVLSIAYKEFKTMLGSTNYSINLGIGAIMSIILSVAALIIGGDKIVSIVTKGAPVPAETIIPALPFVIYFFIGMVASTAISPSIEGKHYWAIKTLPISNMTIFKGKMLFNMLLFGPVGLISVFFLCIAFKAGVLVTVLSLVLIFMLAAFSTEYGLICGVKFIKLDWENDIEVIKQGSAIMVYLLPNMVMSMLFIGGAIALGLKAGAPIVLGAAIVVVTLLSAICYAVIQSLSKKNI